MRMPRPAGRQVPREYVQSDGGQPVGILGGSSAVIVTPVRYVPVPANVPLPTAPRLESWDAAGSPSQSALTTYLRELEQLAAPLVASTDGDLAFALDVALPPGTDLLDQRDLDNYFLPAVRHLTKTLGRPFVSVSGTKQHGSTSFFGIGPAQTAGPADLGDTHRARTTASSETAAFKQQIADALRAAQPVPSGPVALDIVFGVGPARSWMNLWKPTIDALGALLGVSSPARPWHPQDGRVVRLSLHCLIDAALGNDVDLFIVARRA